MPIIVEADFVADLRDLLAAHLASRGYSADASATAETLLWNFLKIQHRLVEARPRKVVRSQTLVQGEAGLPEKYRVALQRIERASLAGEDLNPYLSRQLVTDKAFRAHDGMLNEYGVHHLHLGDGFDDRGLIRGTKELLFAIVGEDEMYFIGVFDHDAFGDEEPFRIALANWPSLFRASGFPAPRSPAEPLTPEQRKTLRKKGANALTVGDDGETYFPPGGGVMSNGMARGVLTEADRLLDHIQAQKRWCRENAEVLAERAVAGGRTRPERFHLRLVDVRSPRTLIVQDNVVNVRFTLE